MPEFDDVLRAALSEHLSRVVGRAPVRLPAVYDDLSQSQRREVRERYCDLQGGLCWYCRGDLSQDPPGHVSGKRITWSKFPVGFLRNPVHLHHDHRSGLTIGSVHAYCNAVLWEYHGE